MYLNINVLNHFTKKKAINVEKMRFLLIKVKVFPLKSPLRIELRY